MNAAPDWPQRALIVGAGVSGVGAAQLLARTPTTVTLVEARDDHPGLDEAQQTGAQVVAGASADRIEVCNFDVVIPSPGVPEHASILVAAEQQDVPVWSEPELAFRYAPMPMLAVTGTNGKTTTTQLLAAMLQASGRPAVACGNLGLPLSIAVLDPAPSTTLVVELSSFQLRFAHTLRPTVGVVLNVADDHLDWHGTRSAYAQAKARIWQAQHGDDWAVACADDPAAHALLMARAPARRRTFSTLPTADARVDTGHEPSVILTADGIVVAERARHTTLVETDALEGRPHHLVSNIAAAATAADLYGIDPTAITRAAASFAQGRHRGEVAAVVDGVTYINDSKATNPHAAAAALTSHRSIVWVAGGLAKGVDLQALGPHLGAVKAAVVIGAAADDLARICHHHGIPTTRAADMPEAVRSAQRLAAPGDVVVLAPACASFDQFRDYADRGDQFIAAVKGLPTGDGDAANGVAS